jgi:3-oxoacyl-[acyl-carrier protein] reductase
MTGDSTKSVIVTGASRGIGRAVAIRLARDGFAVAVNYAGNSSKADEVVAEIMAAGGQVIPVQGDVANAADVDRLFDETVNTFGGINVVVNCAGIMPLLLITGGDLELFDKVITTNLRGTFVVLGRASQHISTGGRIIAFSSSVIAKAFPSYGPYIASKAGVEGLVRVLANELRGRDITVNAVARSTFLHFHLTIRVLQIQARSSSDQHIKRYWLVLNLFLIVVLQVNFHLN